MRMKGIKEIDLLCHGDKIDLLCHGDKVVVVFRKTLNNRYTKK